MRRGTTPVYTLTVEGEDLRDSTVYVTVAQGAKEITKTGDDLKVMSDGVDSVIVFTLTQAETLSLKDGRAEVQVRFIYEDGTALETDIALIIVDRVLLEKVIKYAGY